MANDRTLNKLDRFLDRGIVYYFYRVFWDDQSLQQDFEQASYISRMLELEAEMRKLPRLTVSETDHTYDALIKRLNRLADLPSIITEAEVAQLEKDAKSYQKLKDTNFYVLLSAMQEYVAVRAMRKAKADTRTAEELATETIAKMQLKISAYLRAPTATQEKKAIMSGIQDYLNTGDDSHLATAAAKYDGDYLTRIKQWFASFVSTDEAKHAYDSVKLLRKSPFFHKALEQLAVQKSEKDPDMDSVSSGSFASTVRMPKEYEYDAKIQDFKTSEREVHAIWQAHRVTRDAFKQTLNDMLSSIRDLERKSAVVLPNIPFPEGILSSDAIPEDATVFKHIQHCIELFSEKVDNEKMAAHFQSDCAVLQNAINRILSYSYQGRNTRKMLTTQQRSVCTQIGTTLTKALNVTQKHLVEKEERKQSATTVREEIRRLLNFYNKIAGRLTEFQQDLHGIDQGDFFNDLEYFIEKPDIKNGVKGPLQARQNELHMLLNSLSDCGDAEFNVLDPKGDKQEKVCDAVHKLQGYATSLAAELLSILKTEQELGEDNVLRSTGALREYSSVGDVKKDAIFAPQFAKIMSKIEDFSSTLLNEERSHLDDFFGHEATVADSNTFVSEHQVTPVASHRSTMFSSSAPVSPEVDSEDFSDEETHDYNDSKPLIGHKNRHGGKSSHSGVFQAPKANPEADSKKAVRRVVPRAPGKSGD